jgi:hypothetical protein
MAWRRGEARGETIATVAGPALASILDLILPMGIEYDCVFRRDDGGTKHTKCMKLVQLLGFGCFPKGPIIQVTEFAAIEATQGLLSVGDTFRLDGLNEEAEFIGGDVQGGNGLVTTEGMNSTEFVTTDGQGIGAMSKVIKVMFVKSKGAILEGRQRFRCKGDN